MADFQNGQPVFVKLDAELFGIPLTNGATITKGKIINKQHTGYYVIQLQLEQTTSLIQVSATNIFNSLKEALDSVAEAYNSGIKETSTIIDG